MTTLRTLADLRPGDHLCWAYETEQEHRSLLTAFLRQGLQRGEKVLYLVDAHPADAILGYLRDHGLQVEPYLASGQLRVLQAGDVYLPNGTFDVARMLARVQEEIASACAGGYPALRATGEMTWALEGTDSATLVEYEAALNGFIPGSPCVALCQYPRRLFEPRLLAHLFAVHPTVLVGTSLDDGPNGREGKEAGPPSTRVAASASRPEGPAATGWGRGPAGRALSDRRELLSSAGEVCFRLDAEGRVVDCKVAHGEAPYLQRSALLGRPVVDVLPPELGLEAQRAVDVLPGRAGMIAVECTLSAPEGEQVYEVRAVPLPERQAVLLLRNVTEQRRAEKARQILAEASRALATSLGYETTLQRVARLALPVLADACLVTVTQNPAQPKTVAAHTDPAQEEMLTEMRRQCPIGVARAPLLSEVLQTGQARVLPEVPERLLAALACDAGHLEMLHRWGLESAMIVPLKARGQILGTISFLSTTSGRRYGTADLTLAGELAARAAVAIDNAWLHRCAQRARGEAQAAERRTAFLAEASKALAASLDYETTLQSMARLAVPVLADWCIVEVLKDVGESRQVAVAHQDPTMEALLREFSGQHPPRPGGRHPSYAAMRTGQPQLLEEIADAGWLAGAWDAGQEAIIERLRPRSGMVAPLVARGRTLGAICFASGEAGRYGPADLSLAEELARRCALALDNALLYGQARQAVRVRDEFLSAAAHELKTPVTSLRGFAQLSLRRLESEREVDQARVRRALQVIDRQSDRLSRLVSQLLDVSRLEGGQLRLDRQAIDLTCLIEDVVSTVQACTVRHTLTVDAPSSLPVFVDPLRLEQVLYNLLDSAVKASQNGGPIEVQASAPDRATVRLSVRDHGPGIACKHRQSGLDASEAQADDHFGDLGLSLSISRRIAEQHGGRIEVELPPDGGTRFVVSFPRGINGADHLNRGQP